MRKFKINGTYTKSNHFTIRRGDCLRFLKSLPNGIAQLVLTSPPYNVGKEYEKPQSLEEYLAFQRKVIRECVRITKPGGSICWQLGNHIDENGNLVPLDAALYPIFGNIDQLCLRNRIVWHFGHGLHCHNRFSGRHETVLWYTKGQGTVFNLDDVRVAQKYPGKRASRGAKRGEPTCNPRGKNPGDVWQIPNVKSNHIEKTAHPCQFPIALAEMLILALTNPKHLVVDPFLGAGTTAVAALKNGRKVAGSEIQDEYIAIVRERVRDLELDQLKYRSRTKPIHEPSPHTKVTTPPKGHFLMNGHGS